MKFEITQGLEVGAGNFDIFGVEVRKKLRHEGLSFTGRLEEYDYSLVDGIFTFTKDRGAETTIPQEQFILSREESNKLIELATGEKPIETRSVQ